MYPVSLLALELSVISKCCTTDGTIFNFSRLLALAYIVIGVLILLDRLHCIRLPFVTPTPLSEQRMADYEAAQANRQRQQRIRERTSRIQKQDRPTHLQP